MIGVNSVHTLFDEWICEKHSEQSFLSFKYLSPLFPRYRDRILRNNSGVSEKGEFLF